MVLRRIFASMWPVAGRTAVGLAVIVLLWLGTLAHIEAERVAIRQAIVQDATSLSGVVEEAVVRVIDRVDRTLLFLRRSGESSGDADSWLQLIRELTKVGDFGGHVSIINANRKIVATTLSHQPGWLQNADTINYLQGLINEQRDRLSVSQPFVDPATGDRLVLISRKMTAAPDLGANGVIVASFDPALLMQTHGLARLGGNDAVALVDLAGIVHAAAGRDLPPLGMRLLNAESISQPISNAYGTFNLNFGDEENNRIVSYRSVKDFPIMVAAIASSATENGSFIQYRRTYLWIAGALTILVFASIIIEFRHNQRLAKTQRALTLSTRKANAKSREQELTLNHMTQGIIMVDGTGQVAVINRQAICLLDLPDTYLQKPPSYRELVEFLRARGEYDNSDSGLDRLTRHWILNPYDGLSVPQFERIRPNGVVLEVCNEMTPDGGFVRTFTDVTKRRQSEAEISHLARHDSLTGLANRAMFNEELEVAMFESETQDRLIALHCIDLDMFKTVNDTHGHAIGDKLLRLVAARLKNSVRSEDVVARLGGDEFAIVQRIAAESDASNLAMRILSRMKEPFVIESQNIMIGASIGIAVAMRDASTVEGLLKSADLALYEAKAAGRFGYTVYEPGMNARLEVRRALENDLRVALVNDQFEMHYQPLYVMATETINGFEALVRWRHPHKGLISPSEFIPVAEDIGLIEVIGDWALEQACKELAKMPGHFKIAVNLSAVQFRSNTLVRQVNAALDVAGIQPDRLELEITETTLLRGDELVLKQLHELRALGVRIAMDDFGTGYSSLSYLLQFPFDRIKIDRSFVKELGKTPGSSAIIQAITDLSGRLGMATTAEGVETLEQRDALLALGCCEAQGYLWSPPLPEKDARALYLSCNGDPGGSRQAAA